MARQNIKEVGKGRYRLRQWVRLPDGSKVRIQETVKNTTVRAAEEYLRQRVNEVMTRGVIAPPVTTTSPTIADLWPSFMEHSRVHGENKPSELSNKESYYRNHIGTKIGNVKVAEVKESVLLAFKASLIEGGLSKKSANNVLTALATFLKHTKCPVKVGLFKYVRKEADFLTQAELQTLLKATKGSKYHTVILLGARAGLRVGEILALRKSDIDFARGRINVTQALYRGQLGTPKSGKSRRVKLLKSVADVLTPIVENLGPGDYVIANDDGAPLAYDTVRDALRYWAGRAGLRPLKTHTLRHTFGAHLSERGAPLIAIAKYMGHSTTYVTEMYAHLSPHVEDTAIDVLDVGSANLRVLGQDRVNSDDDFVTSDSNKGNLVPPTGVEPPVTKKSGSK